MPLYCCGLLAFFLNEWRTALYCRSVQWLWLQHAGPGIGQTGADLPCWPMRLHARMAQGSLPWLCAVHVAGVDELVQLADKFVSDIKEGKHDQEGWSNSMYGEHCSFSRNLAKALQLQQKLS